MPHLVDPWPQANSPSNKISIKMLTCLVASAVAVEVLLANYDGLGIQNSQGGAGESQDYCWQMIKVSRDELFYVCFF